MNQPVQNKATNADAPVWLPADAFFVRRATLDSSGPASPQVELALEVAAPFALEQLYYGHLVAADAKSGLVFASHRRLFPGDGWAQASVVLPAFAALLGEPPATARIRLWQGPDSVVAAVWDGTSTLPCQVLAHRTEPSAEAAMRGVVLEEACRRLGGRKPEVEEYAGAMTVTAPAKRQGLELRLGRKDRGGVLVTLLTPAMLETMDVRDKAVLTTRRTSRRRDRILWTALAAALAGLALAAVLDGGVFAARTVFKRWRAEQARVAEDVVKIETAQTLSARIEEMSRRRLRPFEMLAVINDVRPASIQFLRCATNGLTGLEVEGQTGNAASVGAFETALKGVTALESVEIRDVRLREGNTTFQLTAVFKPGDLETGKEKEAGP